MNLDKLSKNNRLLNSLLQQSNYWRRLDNDVKKILPRNLQDYFQTACIENGILVLLAHNNMAASRLKMIVPSLLPALKNLREDIQEVKIKNIPKPPPVVKAKQLKLSEEALRQFEKTTRQVAHHPELAEALQKLVYHHRNNR